MRWTLIQTIAFRSLWKSEGFPDEDLQALESDIMRDPGANPVMKGTGGLRKIRFAPPSRGKGKSGSMRIGYAQFPTHAIIVLVTMFLKRDQANLDPSARNQIKALLDRFSAALARGERI